MSEHTYKPFEADLAKLKDNLLLMGGLIESMLQEAKEALLNNDAELARKVIQQDRQLDQMEKDADELAVQILALRQPAAKDLRFVAAALKISTDLERMGDEIVNICERVIELSEFEPIKPYQDLPKMLDMSSQLISRSLDAFVSLSSQQAGKVLKDDDEIDNLYREILNELVDIMKHRPETIVPAMKLMSVAKYLERLADHATNVAEQVIFMVEGLDVRHSSIRPTP